MEFTTKKFLKMIEDKIKESTGQKLNSLKKNMLVCFFNGLEYKDTYAYLLYTDPNLGYTYSYISREIGPRFMGNLSKAFKVKVTKKTLRGICELIWMRDIQTNFSQKLTPIDRFINFLIDVDWNNQIYVQNAENKNCSLDDYIRKGIKFTNLDFKVMRGIFNLKKSQ